MLSVYFLIRWENIEKIPYGIEGDERSWTILSLARTYKIDAANFGIWGVHRENMNNFPVSVELNKISFLVFGKNIISPRKLLIILDCFTLVCFYFICLNYLSPFVSLLTTTLYSFSTYNLTASRIAIVCSFTNVFLFPAIISVFFVHKNKLKKSLILAFLAGLFTVLSLLTYNTSYLFPLLFIFFVFLSCFKQFSKNKTLLIIFFYLIPFIFLFPRIQNSFTQQFSKKWVFNDALSFSDSPKEITQKITHSIITVKGQLIESFIPDLLANWPGSLFNNKISILALVGTLIVLLQPSKYLFVLLWSFFYLITFHSLLGFNYPRMWISTSALIYLLAGISLNKVKEIIANIRSIFKSLIFSLFLSFVVIVIFQDYRTYSEKALYNSSFASPYMESGRDLIDSLDSLQNKQNKINSFLLVENNEIKASYDQSLLLFNYLSNSANKNLQESDISKTISKSILVNDLTSENKIEELLRFVNENKKSIIIIPKFDFNNPQINFKNFDKIKESKYHKIYFYNKMEYINNE